MLKLNTKALNSISLLDDINDDVESSEQEQVHLPLFLQDDDDYDDEPTNTKEEDEDDKNEEEEEDEEDKKSEKTVSTDKSLAGLGLENIHTQGNPSTGSNLSDSALNITPQEILRRPTSVINKTGEAYNLYLSEEDLHCSSFLPQFIMFSYTLQETDILNIFIPDLNYCMPMMPYLAFYSAVMNCKARKRIYVTHITDVITAALAIQVEELVLTDYITISIRSFPAATGPKSVTDASITIKATKNIQTDIGKILVQSQLLTQEDLDNIFENNSIFCIQDDVDSILHDAREQIKHNNIG